MKGNAHKPFYSGSFDKNGNCMVCGINHALGDKCEIEFPDIPEEAKLTPSSDELLLTDGEKLEAVNSAIKYRTYSFIQGELKDSVDATAKAQLAKVRPVLDLQKAEIIRLKKRMMNLNWS